MGFWSENVPEETLTRDEASKVMRRLFRMLRPYRVRILFATVVLMAQAAALLAGPALVRYGIDNGLPHGDFDGDAGALNLAVACYLALAFAGFALGRASILLVARIGESFLRELRNRVFRHLMGLSLDYFEKDKTGRVVARMTSDVDALQELISQGLVLFVMNIFLFIGAVIVLLATSGSSRWVCS
jgi:ATP-binding cassette subfamily B protein